MRHKREEMKRQFRRPCNLIAYFCYFMLSNFPHLLDSSKVGFKSKQRTMALLVQVLLFFIVPKKLSGIDIPLEIFFFY